MVFYPKLGIFKVFSHDELLEIHYSTLEVLRNVGTIVENDKIIKFLQDAGAYVDHKKRIVKFPDHLITEAIKKAPKNIVLAGREKKYDLHLNEKAVYYGLGGGPLYILDSRTGRPRRTTKRDVAEAARIGDALPNVNFIMSMASSQDYPQHLIGLHNLDAMLRNTVKPIIVMDYGSDVSPLIRMAEAVVGEGNLEKRPIICLYSEPVSPLKHGKEYLDNILKFARSKLPVVYIPSPMYGATAPATLAGGLVQANAETLSGNAILQLMNPGSPFIYGADPSVMDMRTGVFSYGSPEWMLSNIALAQLGRYYGLPIWSTGGCSDSKVLDAQAAIEAALTIFVATASGGNLIHDFGFLDFGMTYSLELVIICDEIASLVKRILSGIEVNDETLALDVIANVGPGGHFLTQVHTLKNYKREHWFPTLLDRDRRHIWKMKGSRDLVQRAREKTEYILRTHVVEPLPKEIRDKIDRIIKNAEGGQN